MKIEKKLERQKKRRRGESGSEGGADENRRVSREGISALKRSEVGQTH